MTGIMKHTAHASQPHTLPSRSKSQPHDQNLSKSVSVPTHGRQESAANFEDNKTDDKERQCITTYIKHLAGSGLSSVSARFKSSCNLTGNRFEMPNVSYTQPLYTHVSTKNLQNIKSPFDDL